MEIPYMSLPGDMIDTITLDVDEIKIGDVLKVKDIPELTSEKIELQVDMNEIVLRMNEKKQQVQVETEE